MNLLWFPSQPVCSLRCPMYKTVSPESLLQSGLQKIVSRIFFAYPSISFFHMFQYTVVSFFWNILLVSIRYIVGPADQTYENQCYYCGADEERCPALVKPRHDCLEFLSRLCRLRTLHPHSHWKILRGNVRRVIAERHWTTS